LDCGAENVCPAGMNRGRLRGQSLTDFWTIIVLTLTAECMSDRLRRQCDGWPGAS